MRKGFIQQLARAVWGWLGLCLCCASSFCANVLAFCSRIAGITDWDVEETESGGDSGVPGRRLEDLGLASPSCLCKGIWLSEGFPSPCSQERGLLREGSMGCWEQQGTPRERKQGSWLCKGSSSAPERRKTLICNQVCW